MSDITGGSQGPAAGIITPSTDGVSPIAISPPLGNTASITPAPGIIGVTPVVFLNSGTRISVGMIGQELTAIVRDGNG
ncbi:MAG: hypothetical protein GY774_05725 [Planctomycetes bacterium]|nr:hypothetical protein [Planctomycetota bacterium]